MADRQCPPHHERRFRHVRGESGLPPTPERLRQRSEPTLRANCRLMQCSKTPLPITAQALGVLGLGKIGSRVAAVGTAFGMKVIAWSEKPPARAGLCSSTNQLSRSASTWRSTITDPSADSSGSTLPTGHGAGRPVLLGSAEDGRQALGYVEPDRAPAAVNQDRPLQRLSRR